MASSGLRAAVPLLLLAMVGVHYAQDMIDEVGEYALEMHTAKSGLYQSFFTAADYPLHVFLNNKIYSEISVPLLSGDVVVLLDALFATVTNNRSDPERYDLVKDRCAINSAIDFLSSPADKFRFSFDMFAFTKNMDRLFLHADTFLCHQGSQDNRCSSGCQGDRLTRVRRTAGDSLAAHPTAQDNYQLVMGPFVKAELIPKPADHAHDDNDSNYTLIVGCFVVAFVAVGAFLFVECRVHREKIALAKHKNAIVAKNGVY